MTRARRLYVSRISKLRESDPRDRASIKIMQASMQARTVPSPAPLFSRFHPTVHMKCAVPQKPSSSNTNTQTISKEKLNVSPLPDPSPGRSMTRARRLYVSRISKLRESDRPQTRGSAQDVRCRQCAKDGAFGTIVSSGEYRRSRDPERNTFRRRMHPAPQRQELERLVCSAS